MQTAAKRSYLGIAACLMFAVATMAILAVVAANWGSQQKLAGYELIVVGPFALLLYGTGFGFAVAGRRRPAENPLSTAGTVLNWLGLALFLSGAVGSAVGG
jgi:hypothetical protein